jgi:voltage-gated potassium channel
MMPELSDREDPAFTRTEVVKTIGLAALCVAVLLTIYYTLPIAPDPREAVWLRLTVVVVVFGVVLVHEVNAIAKHGQPMQRAVIALAVLIPLFIVMFSTLYLITSRSDAAAFGTSMSRTQALYFTVVVLSTVGFGDITPKTDPARLLPTIQIVCDLLLVGVVIRLILKVATRPTRRPDSHPDGT